MFYSLLSDCHPSTQDMLSQILKRQPPDTCCCFFLSQISQIFFLLLKDSPPHHSLLNNSNSYDITAPASLTLDAFDLDFKDCKAFSRNNFSSFSCSAPLSEAACKNELRTKSNIILENKKNKK